MNGLPSHVKRIINYIRKSREEELREEQTGIDALERQRIQMEAVLRQYGIPFDQVKEVGSGDKIETRPVFQQVLKDLEKGKYQAIACRDIQRLGRGSYADMGKIYELLESKRIPIITEHRIYDPRNADDAKFIRMQLFISREEYFMIKERLVGARYFKAKEEGKFMGSRPPYGYRANPKTKKLEPFEKEAEIVRLIFQWYVEEDLGYQAICSRLRDMGVPTYMNGENWRGTVIRKILKNPVYIGDIYYRMTEVVRNQKILRPKEEWIVHQGAHPPLIEEALYYKAQEKMQTKGKGILPVRVQFQPSELAGIVWCGECGQKWVRQSSVQRYQKRSGEWSTYHKEFLYCKQCRTSVKYRDVEKSIMAMLDFLPSPDAESFQRAMSESLRQIQKHSPPQWDQKQLMELKKKWLKRLDFIFEAYENGEYSKEQFLQRKNRAEQELRLIEKKLDEASQRLSQSRPSPHPMSDVRFKSWSEFYLKLELRKNKNRMLSKMFERIEVKVLEKGRGRVPAKLWVKGVLRFPFWEK